MTESKTNEKILDELYFVDDGNPLPNRSNEITLGKGLTATSYPLAIKIDKDYFLKKFKRVFNDYSIAMQVGMDLRAQMLFLNDIMGCFDEKDDE